MPIKLTAAAINANANTRGNAASPTQYAVKGQATHAKTPTIVAGWYPVIDVCEKNSTEAKPRTTISKVTTATGPIKVAPI